MSLSSSGTKQPEVLIVDDDQHLLTALSRGLTLQGFGVASARNAREALDSVESSRPDVMVLDIMMPGLDGLQMCQLVRDQYPAVAILMLTALDSVPDRVAGLRAGADDYLVKPFALDELVARLHALLRRSGAASESVELAYGDVALNTATWSATRGGEPLPLTTKEFKLLELLLRSPGRVITRDQILTTIWGGEPPIESNVVDVHVANLRQKLEAGSRTRLIRTIRGVGFAIREA
jgi:DNA-binding response OmpR family regulator